MAKYEVKWRYVSSLAGPFQAGDVVELEPEVAEAVNRDSPGVLASAERAVEGGKDRMQKPKSKRKE